jgi:hypothetical protein
LRTEVCCVWHEICFRFWNWIGGFCCVQMLVIWSSLYNVSWVTFAVMWNSFLAVEASQPAIQPARVGDLGFTREVAVWLVILWTSSVAAAPSEILQEIYDQDEEECTVRQQRSWRALVGIAYLRKHCALYTLDPILHNISYIRVLCGTAAAEEESCLWGF